MPPRPGASRTRHVRPWLNPLLTSRVVTKPPDRLPNSLLTRRARLLLETAVIPLVALGLGVTLPHPLRPLALVLWFVPVMRAFHWGRNSVGTFAFIWAFVGPPIQAVALTIGSFLIKPICTWSCPTQNHFAAGVTTIAVTMLASLVPFLIVVATGRRTTRELK
jgi:hypothetical protein